MVEETISLRRSLLWGAIAFGGVLAVIVGVRLEQAALTAVVGVACGVGASIPTSILLVALLQKRNAQKEQKRRQFAAQAPPVVIVTPQAAAQYLQPGARPDDYTLPVPSQRRFSVIGEDEITDF
jgi:hypothetical protein